MKILVSFFSIVIFISCKSKDSPVRHGTLIIAAIGTDGIIIATDSRITFSPTSSISNLTGYWDSCQKIFDIKGYPLAVEGSYTLNNTRLKEVAEEYSTSAVQPTDCLENFKSFMNYMKENYPPFIYPNVSRNEFFSAGFIDNEPNLLWAKYDGGRGFKNNFITTSDKFDSTFKLVYKKTTCIELAIIAEKAIYDYINDLKLKGSAGPVSIIKITPDNHFFYIQNDFSGRYGQGEMQGF